MTERAEIAARLGAEPTNPCQHGRLAATCLPCQLIAARAEISRLEAELALERARNRNAGKDYAEQSELLAAAEAEVATLREALQDIGHELLRAEAHCPCGARRESPSTHPHVIDCPIGNAIARFEPLATPTATAGALDSLIEHERWNSGRVDPTATAREGGEG